MALIKTIQEVKAVLRISSLDDDMSLPDVEQAANKHIIPAIGKEIVDEISAVYDDGSGTPVQKDLIQHIQKPLAAFAYLDDIGLIHATINDRGVSRISTSDMPAAYRWEFEEVKDSLQDKALNGMEVLLQFLVDHQADFPTWANSDAYREYFQFLIESGNTFNKMYSLYQPLRTFQALKPCIQLVEDMYISTEIGADFLEELKKDEGTQPEILQVISYLQKSEAYLTIKHAIEMLPVRISNRGFTVVDADLNTAEDNRQPAPDNLLSLKMRAADRDGRNYLKRAVQYLNQNASDTLFITYFNSDKYKDPAKKKPFTRGNEGRKIFNFG